MQRPYVRQRIGSCDKRQYYQLGLLPVMKACAHWGNGDPDVDSGVIGNDKIKEWGAGGESAANEKNATGNPCGTTCSRREGHMKQQH
mmetsp:Transcript_1003/g.1844  ORF Transcript_1003/g.1844 Transcript_1003/m.1844 type:complete len:87 (-) Transcript_1003:3136-3396(-)